MAKSNGRRGGDMKKEKTDTFKISIKEDEQKALHIGDLVDEILKQPDKPVKDKLSAEELKEILSFYFVHAQDFPELTEKIDPIVQDLLKAAPNDYKFQLMDSSETASKFMRERIFNIWNTAAREEGPDSPIKEISENFQYEDLIEALNSVGGKTKTGLDLSYLEIGRVTDNLKAAVDKWLGDDPFLIALLEEVEKMKGDASWAGADLERITIDVPQSKAEFETPSLHNQAIGEAFRRAQERVKEEERRQQPELFDIIEGGEETPPLPAEPITGFEAREKIKSQYQVISLVQKFITIGNIFNKGTQALDMGRGAITKVSVSIDEDKNVKGLEHLTGYEWEVSNALYTLWIKGIRNFTLKHLYQVLVMDFDTIPTKEKEEELAQILLKFRAVEVKIDASQELQRITKDKGAKDVTGGKYFDLRWRHVSAYGQDIVVYSFLGEEPPIVLDHAIKTNRVVAFPQRFFNVKGKKGQLIYNTEERTAIMGYLLRRIRQMQNPKTGETKKGQSAVINFENMFQDLSIESTNRMKEKRNRDSVFLLLDHLKKEGLFRSYNTIKGGRGGAIKGVEIIF